MAGKIIEIIVLLVGLLITAAIVVTIPMKSYNEYKDYLAQIEEQNEANKQAAIKPKVESLTVELKEGVRYFANDLADPKVEHFTVTANYVKGEEKYSEPVEDGKFDITVPADFYSKGGDIKFTFKGATATLTIKLEPVVIESLKVLDNPYTVKYVEGSTFDATGMVIEAVYNDGSTKIVSAGEYVVDTQTALTTADNKVTVSYQVGETVKTVDVAIGVSKTLDNGAVSSIEVLGDTVVMVGDSIAQASISVAAVYESGNKILLPADQYTISGTAEAVKFGKAYELTVTYNADATKTAKTKAIIRQTVQGEDGIVVGGSIKTETEYVINNGVITELPNTVSFAGGFAKAVESGGEGSLTLVINSEVATIGNITMRCSNSYAVGSKGNYSMQPLQINTILDLTINGREVQIPATVVLKGCGPYEDYAPLYGIYYEFTFEDVALDPGANIVKFNFKNSTVGAKTCWDESPSTMNIDYVNFDSVGNEVPDDYTITGIEISNVPEAEYKQSFDSIIISVVGTIDNGSKIGIDPSLYNVSIKGGQEGDTYFRFGTYTIEVSLKSNPEIKASAECTVEVYKSFTVLNAYFEVDGDKVYYVLTGKSTGYTAEDFVLFDGTVKLPIEATFTDEEFLFKSDVTSLNVGTTFYPHMSIEGKNYVNGENNNGDIMGNGLSFKDGQRVSLGTKTYTITKQYSMPTIVVSQRPDYSAVKDNSFVSNKTLIGTYVYGSDGVSTSGDNKNDEYVGGIGGLDAGNDYVEYTFTVTEDGKVDFVWNVSGNCWNGGVNSGLEDMAIHLTVTIDDKKVDVAGISLPAGTDDSEWWNMNLIIVEDVELTAGEHTFKCVVTERGSSTDGGLNVGDMKIYFTAN